MENNKRKVAIFTGNRAEYGLQYSLLSELKRSKTLEYQLIVSGAHLDKNFGDTLQEIKDDGFRIDSEVKIDKNGSSRISTALAIGSGVTNIARALECLNPDIVVVYADRFEGFAAVVAATQMSIPTAHIEGGDLTEGGALDDSIRHAMTKLSHLHFTTNKQASNRILAMGEESWRVKTVGLPALDMIMANNFANQHDCSLSLGIDLMKPIVIFTQHSITTEINLVKSQITPSLEALRRLAEREVQILITYPNNDTGSLDIISSIEELKSENHPHIKIVKSLGRNLYHGVLALARNPSSKIACVGNSSSGIKETPAFGCPTVNIGSRQAGRLRGENVIDVGYDSSEIFAAIEKCLFDNNFKERSRGVQNPYYFGGAGAAIVKTLSETPLDKYLLQKKMNIIGEVNNGWYR